MIGAEIRDADAPATFWLETSLTRVFPTTPPGSMNLRLLSARGSKTAFQACLQNRRTQPLYVDCNVIGADDLKPQVRPLMTH
jgi:hypothetical protein